MHCIGMDDAPATKRDLIELEQRFDAKLGEKLGAMETRLLRAFYEVGESWNKRKASRTS